MTIKNEVLSEDLRAWLKSPAIGLPEYSADLLVQRRVGRMIGNFGATVLPHAQRKSVLSSIRSRFPDKP
jgi:hypothetical protein